MALAVKIPLASTDETLVRGFLPTVRSFWVPRTLLVVVECPTVILEFRKKASGYKIGGVPPKKKPISARLGIFRYRPVTFQIR